MARRTFLSALGLAPASAVMAESFVPSSGDGRLRTGMGLQPETFAKAFEALAVEIRNGNVLIEDLNFSTSLKPDDIVGRYLMQMNCVFLPEERTT